MQNGQKNSVNFYFLHRMWTSQMQAQPQLPQKQQQQQQQQQASNLRTLGMTSAISLAGPKQIDHQRTTELQLVLVPYNVFETDEELNHR
jgi:poly(A) polymerase